MPPRANKALVPQTLPAATISDPQPSREVCPAGSRNDSFPEMGGADPHYVLAPYFLPSSSHVSEREELIAIGNSLA